jgi:hypothetical protein
VSAVGEPAPSGKQHPDLRTGALTDDLLAIYLMVIPPKHVTLFGVRWQVPPATQVLFFGNCAVWGLNHHL